MCDLKKILYVLLLCVAVCACNKHEREFKIEGTLEGGADTKIVLEQMDAEVGWVKVSEIKTDGDGNFTITAPAPEFPELYRLNCDGKFVYLPIDSTETLSLRAKAKDISRGFDLSGSPQAKAMTEFEAEVIKLEGCDNADSLQNFRRRVYEKYLKEAKGNIFSYYVLMRRIGDDYLIDYTDPIYRAVATSFKTFKPDDPHTPLLAERARIGLNEDRKRKGITTVIDVPQTAMLEIKLPDISDDEIALSSVLGKGKPVVLVFGGMTIPDAPFINMELRKLYDAGKADIYQVCLDTDRFVWSQAAKALPWTVVFDPEGLHSSAAARYNLASIPAYFIYDSAGELINSTGDIKQVESMLK